MSGEKNYQQWIAAHQPIDPRGKCFETTVGMAVAFPELRRVRGYYICPRLNGPAQYMPRVRCEATYRARLINAAERQKKTVIAAPDALVAYVNDGRWLADCPHCRSGIAVHPEWPEAHCLQCCRTFGAVTVPEDWAAIERVLAVRAEYHQHWRPTESLERLRWENLAHGLPEESPDEQTKGAVGP